MSPWAFGVPGSIRFGVTLHRSFIINYIEKLEYVDYVEDVRLIKGDEASFTNIAPSSPKAILVSAKQHGIDPVNKTCTEKPETKEEDLKEAAVMASVQMEYVRGGAAKFFMDALLMEESVVTGKPAVIRCCVMVAVFAAWKK